jgi:hypothetical protein
VNFTYIVIIDTRFPPIDAMTENVGAYNVPLAA